jgi:hypothetical protein
MNCDAPIAAGEMKLFAEVCVCEGCYNMATRMHERALKELKVVLVMMKESIRLALLQKKLQFRTPEELQNVKKPELLGELGRLVEAAQERQRHGSD